MTVIPFAQVSDATVARLTGRPSASDVVLEREVELAAARKRMKNPDHLPAKVIHSDCATLMGYGDVEDKVMAPIIMAALERRERRRMVDEAKAEAARLSRAGRKMSAVALGYVLAVSLAVALRWGGIV